MFSERQHHQALELKQNISALDPVELLNYTNNPKVPEDQLRAHLIQSAILAKWAYEGSDGEPDPTFKSMETEILNRVHDLNS